mmetsp:Transcript_128527/g.226442  ORF Transcript_128527/g.226442 Transcript_128527/m.226442 type:complete len:388 (-) Transcript_128527:79-1242(-)
MTDVKGKGKGFAGKDKDVCNDVEPVMTDLKGKGKGKFGKEKDFCNDLEPEITHLSRRKARARAKVLAEAKALPATFPIPEESCAGAAFSVQNPEVVGATADLTVRESLAGQYLPISAILALPRYVPFQLEQSEARMLETSELAFLESKLVESDAALRQQAHENGILHETIVKTNTKLSYEEHEASESALLKTELAKRDAEECGILRVSLAKTNARLALEEHEMLEFALLRSTLAEKDAELRQHAHENGILRNTLAKTTSMLAAEEQTEVRLHASLMIHQREATANRNHCMAELAAVQRDHQKADIKIKLAVAELQAERKSGKPEHELLELKPTSASGELQFVRRSHNNLLEQLTLAEAEIQLKDADLNQKNAELRQILALAASSSTT